MRYKIVEDKKYGLYHVMYKRFWFSFWKYARAPKTKWVNFCHVWTWQTKKGAETFIGQQLKDANKK